MLSSIFSFHKIQMQQLLPSLLAALAVCAFHPTALLAEQIPVRHLEGVTHGFLVLRTLDGTPIADGDLKQIVKGGRVTSDLTFRFKDGSFYEETTVYWQRGRFRLLSDRIVQKGPSFKQQTDTSIDAITEQITVRTMENGKEKVKTQHLDLPEDVSNGLIFTLVKNIEPTVPQTTISMVAASSKARLVKLNISPQGEDTFSVDLLSYKAQHFVVKVDIPGVAGVVAPVVGKQPPDIHLWVIKSEAPVFVQFEGPLYAEGPVWRLELNKPDYSKK
ncbi:MAG: hypothetical protein JWO71_4221 [Candidatus Acidoferrum typicum]|nr:hypothetical protein [Candidatus Acidoferrum typicum]